MQSIQQLSHFLNSIPDDPRLGPYHISLYMSLYHHWLLNGCMDQFHIQRESIMQMAKISGIATYHKCIKELDEYGYIKYRPSYNPAGTTKVVMNCMF